ncbi:hypothetical protein R70006_00267 [Paraburkholderia domus]|uniref:DUF6339 family protein n=1 Tax=Paraburkholderia domus TaxID=2793075 RepID=UPI0019136404|nr:DUF6339 family protein [Paraburkholderia domus]MBK5047744.1 hypothetical protein [Burkholderia sp. R-70006]CAE6689387.1 hypothetical protein R70006_00267 [Paraburkholderia domus]
MKLRYIKQTNLDQLKASLDAVAPRFANDSPWLDEFFAGQVWSLESQVSIANEIVLTDPEPGNHHDLENSKKIHEALKALNISQATDERLWAYLGLVNFWGYMRKRWPMERYGQKDSGSSAANLRERYFFVANPDRALVRNGIARLWWYGHVSYDAERADPYELTKILLDKLDVAQSLLERSFSRNPVVCRAVLNFMLKEQGNGRDVSERKTFRLLMQHLNRLGGMAILDLFTQADIEAELESALLSIAN